MFYTLDATIASPPASKRMSVRYSQVRFDAQPFRVHEDFTVSAGGFCCFVWDLEGRRRRANLTDVQQGLKLADALDQIAYTGLPCSDHDIPAHVRPVAMAAELVKATRKFGGIETFRGPDAAYIARIGEIVCGGREAHQANPILVGYAEARSPLCIDETMVDVMLAHLELGLPQSLDTMPNADRTAPMSAAGVLALGLAETLGGLVVGFAVDPHATLTVDITPGYCDMRSMLFNYAGAERLPLLAARVQLISEYYGCPSGIHGGTQSALWPIASRFRSSHESPGVADSGVLLTNGFVRTVVGPHLRRDYSSFLVRIESIRPVSDF